MDKSINRIPSEIRSGIEIALNDLHKIRPDEELDVKCEMLDLDASLNSARVGKLSRACTIVASEGDLCEGQRSLVINAAIFTWLREQMPFLD